MSPGRNVPDQDVLVTFVSQLIVSQSIFLLAAHNIQQYIEYNRKIDKCSTSRKEGWVRRASRGNGVNLDFH